jgi:hypothetical protein
MIHPDAASRLLGDTVVDADGREVGQVVEVYRDEDGLPAYIAVATGLVGRHTVVPLAEAEFMGNRLRITYPKSVVEGAPPVEVDRGRVGPVEAGRLDRYYGVGIDHGGRPAGSAPAPVV